MTVCSAKGDVERHGQFHGIAAITNKTHVPLIALVFLQAFPGRDKFGGGSPNVGPILYSYKESSHVERRPTDLGRQLYVNGRHPVL